MSATDFKELITAETLQLLTDKGLEAPASLEPGWKILEEGLDSLDLATLIVVLESKTGVDPFRSGFREFTSIGELIELYRNA